MNSRHLRTCLALLYPLLAASCGVLGGHRIIEERSGRELQLAELAQELEDYDVIFLGEEHDNDAAHRLQIKLTRALLARRGEVAISLEMFERDTQSQLDFYLAGVIDEEQFLATSRPWPNYAEHYRPAVELARSRGLDVLAANCPRPAASRVYREGLPVVLGDPWCAYNVNTDPGPYCERMRWLMGGHGHGDEESFMRLYAAQCIKDDTMAESIARYLDARGQHAPQVIHWCGKFHSDYGLGTVERLLRRKPHLRIAIISTTSDGERPAPLADGRRVADYLWLVPG